MQAAKDAATSAANNNINNSIESSTLLQSNSNDLKAMYPTVEPPESNIKKEAVSLLLVDVDVTLKE